MCSYGTVMLILLSIASAKNLKESKDLEPTDDKAAKDCGLNRNEPCCKIKLEDSKPEDHSIHPGGTEKCKCIPYAAIIIEFDDMDRKHHYSMLTTGFIKPNDSRLETTCGNNGNGSCCPIDIGGPDSCKCRLTSHVVKEFRHEDIAHYFCFEGQGGVDEETSTNGEEEEEEEERNKKESVLPKDKRNCKASEISAPSDSPSSSMNCGKREVCCPEKLNTTFGGVENYCKNPGGTQSCRCKINQKIVIGIDPENRLHHYCMKYLPTKPGEGHEDDTCGEHGNVTCCPELVGGSAGCRCKQDARIIKKVFMTSKDDAVFHYYCEGLTNSTSSGQISTSYTYNTVLGVLVPISLSYLSLYLILKAN